MQNKKNQRILLQNNQQITKTQNRKKGGKELCTGQKKTNKIIDIYILIIIWNENRLNSPSKTHWDMVAHSHHFYPRKYWQSEPVQVGNKKK